MFCGVNIINGIKKQLMPKTHKYLYNKQPVVETSYKLLGNEKEQKGSLAHRIFK